MCRPFRWDCRGLMLSQSGSQGFRPGLISVAPAGLRIWSEHTRIPQRSHYLNWRDFFYRANARAREARVEDTGSPTPACATTAHAEDPGSALGYVVSPLTGLRVFGKLGSQGFRPGLRCVVPSGLFTTQRASSMSDVIFGRRSRNALIGSHALGLSKLSPG